MWLENERRQRDSQNRGKQLNKEGDGEEEVERRAGMGNSKGWDKLFFMVVFSFKLSADQFSVLHCFELKSFMLVLFIIISILCNYFIEKMTLIFGSFIVGK